MNFDDFLYTLYWNLPDGLTNFKGSPEGQTWKLIEMIQD